MLKAHEKLLSMDAGMMYPLLSANAQEKVV